MASNAHVATIAPIVYQNIYVFAREHRELDQLISDSFWEYAMDSVIFKAWKFLFNAHFFQLFRNYWIRILLELFSELLIVWANGDFI